MQTLLYNVWETHLSGTARVAIDLTVLPNTHARLATTPRIQSKPYTVGKYTYKALWEQLLQTLQSSTKQKRFQQPVQVQFIKQQRAKGHVQVAPYNMYKIIHQKHFTKIP